MNKLTLSVDKKTVQLAKKIAAANGVSVSSMVRGFVHSVGASHKLPTNIARLAQASSFGSSSKKSGKR